jgi:hypothetical protein
MFRHQESQRQRQAQPDNNFFADADGPIFRDGRRLTRAQGVGFNLFQERKVTPLVVTSTLVMFMKLVPTLEYRTHK